MAEIYVKDGETKEEVARRLLDQAAHPDHVVWSPRSGQEAGGVFTVPDDEVDDLVARVEAKRDAERRETERRIAAADERDQLAGRTGLTPEQLGFSANAAGDPGSFPIEDVESDDDEPEEAKADEEQGQSPPSTGDEPELSRAEKRRRDRKAAADAAAKETTAAPAEKTDKE